MSDPNDQTRPLGPRIEVLVVDDQPDALRLLERELTDAGLSVRTAASGEAALEWLSDNRPDAVVLDALMPGIDGFETCRRLREADEFEQLPVLMMTGLDDDASIERAYEAGATDFYVADRFARRAIVGTTENYGDNIVRLVSDTVARWDASTITDRVENAVGSDLQFIRINGTLVGGLAGIIIHAIGLMI
jgi:CheY-like chemotaxis protein